MPTISTGFEMLRLPGSLRFTALSQALQRRTFHFKAVHSIFPASLIYYSPKQNISLFDHKESEARVDNPYDDGVDIASDRYVYPGVDKQSGRTLT